MLSLKVAMIFQDKFYKIRNEPSKYSPFPVNFNFHNGRVVRNLDAHTEGVGSNPSRSNFFLHSSKFMKMGIFMRGASPSLLVSGALTTWLWNIKKFEPAQKHLHMSLHCNLKSNFDIDF